MRDHNNNNKNGERKGMMWMMIPCLLLLSVLFLGGSKLSSGYLWLIIIGVCVIPHIWMIFKGRGDHNGEEKTDVALEKQSSAKDEHKYSGGCHY